MTNKPNPTADQVLRPSEDARRTETTSEAKLPIVIQPIHGWIALDLSELWHYRELLYFLTWRDIKVRYKQTTIGAAWAILQPFLTMVVFSVVFGELAGLSSDGIPYPVFSFVGILPWTFFASAVARAGASLVTDANLISKVYFPRLIVPIAAVLAITVDFGITFVILVGMMLFYGIVPGIEVLTLLFFVSLTVLTALGLGFWLAALNVKYRDVAQAVPFLIQLLLFVTPVAYSSSLVPEKWRLLYGLNPMAGVVEGFRWALLGQGKTLDALIVVSTFVGLALFISGLFHFRRAECEFADVV